jgi:hypothetical protein
VRAEAGRRAGPKMKPRLVIVSAEHHEKKKCRNIGNFFFGDIFFSKKDRYAER